MAAQILPIKPFTHERFATALRLLEDSTSGGMSLSEASYLRELRAAVASPQYRTNQVFVALAHVETWIAPIAA